ncbi:mutator type transposase [Tanacetum coccineum]
MGINDPGTSYTTSSTSSTADDFSFRKFKEVEVEVDTESEEEEEEEEINTEGNDTNGSDSEDLDYDPKHDDVLDDDEHIVEEVHVNMNNFSFTADHKHDTSIGDVDVQEDDLDVIDYDSFGSDLDDGIDSERIIQLRELRRIGKQKNKGPNKYYFYLGQQFASKEIMKERVKKHSVETRRQLILVKNDNERVRVRYEGTIPALVTYVAIDTNMDKNIFSQTKGGPAIRENSNNGKHNILECRWEVKTLIKDHTCIQSRTIKAYTYRFLAYHVIKLLATNPGIPMRAVQDQMQKQFKVGVSKMKAFKAKRIASDIMIGSYREQYLLLREYAQELINQNLGTTVRIDVQQEPNLKSLTRIFRRVYVCLGVLKQGFRACGRKILGLDGCFMSGPWPSQILTAVGVDANNRIYPVAYAIVEAESTASWCWFLNLLGEDLGIEANFNYTFISNRQKGLIQAIASVFPSAEHKYCVRHIHVNIKSQFKGVTGPYKDQYVVNMDSRVCSCRKWELTGIPCKHVVAAIYNMSENSMGVGIPEQWDHTAYILETGAHVYSFKVNPCNGRDIWPVVESRTVIIPPLFLGVVLDWVN